MSKGSSWTTIESDPGVFTELIQQMGVKGVQVEELHSLDDQDLQALSPVYGLIFLFKWRAEKDDREIDQAAMDRVWFANQVINNACATQAIISVLFNRSDLELGEELANLKSFSMDFPPQMKGLTIGNSEVIRNAHNSFRPPEAFVSDETDQEKDSDDVYHFISYLPVDGVLYELDGLKEGPIRLSECAEENWLGLAAPVIRDRIEQYAKNEIRFNLMAVIRNRKEVLEGQLKDQEALRERLSSSVSAEPGSMEVDSGDSELDARLMQIETEIVRLKDCIAGEDRKHLAWRNENIRRKHNYIPFLFNFLKVLAEKDLLKGLIQKAKDEQEHREDQSGKM
ncbi:hypothetical protein BSKO_08425 [Bryopsis sp. KO-2023]|nr:hypothetical protein BSKO_08425 [Bryopsis sp. KO-2023]